MSRMDFKLTAAGEDYLEMIFRLSKEKGYARGSELSAALNVQPPAATRMVQRLAELKLIEYEKYGVLNLTDKGREIGEFLLQRHGTVERFLKIMGVTEDDVLEETEKVEHTMSKNTLRCLSLFIEFAEANPRFFAAYNLFRKQSERREQ
jgi:Mn-dependent DtxR family transcriptional regulator